MVTFVKQLKLVVQHAQSWFLRMNLLGSAITAIKPRLDDTVVDRLNYYYSTVIIMVMSITLTARQYVGQPLQCWVPAEFSKAWEQYAENYW